MLVQETMNRENSYDNIKPGKHFCSTVASQRVSVMILLDAR